MTGLCPVFDVVLPWFTQYSSAPTTIYCSVTMYSQITIIHHKVNGLYSLRMVWPRITNFGWVSRPASPCNYTRYHVTSYALQVATVIQHCIKVHKAGLAGIVLNSWTLFDARSPVMTNGISAVIVKLNGSVFRLARPICQSAFLAKGDSVFTYILWHWNNPQRDNDWFSYLGEGHHMVIMCDSCTF